MTGFRLSALVRVVAASAVVAVTTSLSACSLVPDLAPESLSANRQACDSLSSVWSDLGAVLESSDLSASASVIEQLPDRIASAQNESTDAALDDALGTLQEQLSNFAATGMPDLAKLTASGVSLAARCAVFGVTPDLTLPGM